MITTKIDTDYEDFLRCRDLHDKLKRITKKIFDDVDIKLFYNSQINICCEINLNTTDLIENIICHWCNFLKDKYSNKKRIEGEEYPCFDIVWLNDIIFEVNKYNNIGKLKGSFRIKTKSKY